jgi:hypothetical protein
MNTRFLDNSRWLVPALLLFLAGCSSEGTGQESENKKDEKETSTPALETPEATLRAAQSAAASHDYPALCRLMTPSAREQMAAGLVALGGFLKAVSKGKEKSPQAKLAEKIGEVFEKHGLNEKTIPRIRINGNASQEDQDRELRKLAGPVKDHCAFVADVLKTMREYGDRPDARLIEENARLEDLKVSGDTATATFVQSRKGKESKSPIAFQKVEGSWKISKIPTWMN